MHAYLVISHFPEITPRRLAGHLVTFAVLFSFFPTNVFSAAVPTELTVIIGEEQKTFTAAEISAWYAVRTERHFRRDARIEVESDSGCPTTPLYCAFALQIRSRDHIVGSAENTLLPEKLTATLTALAGEVNQPPANARFTITDGQVTVAEAERAGHMLSVADASIVLATALTSPDPPANVFLPTETVTPEIRGADRERLGLRELIGEGKTNFTGSPKNRVFNIKRALQEFDGVLIAPGEEFSFVSRLGPVDGEHGYLPELVIKNNRTEPEFGGGICQVSTTVFRAAFNSGFKITERRNHAYPVQYYKPYGMDATIYIPKPDLKFRNNTSGYVFLQPRVEGFNLIFQVFGTNDGRTVKIDGPHILERGGDGSMRTLFTQTVTDSSGETIIEDNFFSNYKSPSLFPHPGDEVLTVKPKGWSDREWKEYLRTRPAGR